MFSHICEHLCMCIKKSISPSRFPPTPFSHPSFLFVLLHIYRLKEQCDREKSKFLQTQKWEIAKSKWRGFLNSFLIAHATYAHPALSSIECSERVPCNSFYYKSRSEKVITLKANVRGKTFKLYSVRMTMTTTTMSRRGGKELQIELKP
jgi:hypothetical protein